MQKEIRDILTSPPSNQEVPVSGGDEREIFPGYVTNTNFPETVTYVVKDWGRPRDYIPGGLTENASVTLSLVYWNRKKLEEGKVFICPVGNRKEDRLERLLSLAYRMEDVLVHSEKALGELKGLVKAVLSW